MHYRESTHSLLQVSLSLTCPIVKSSLLGFLLCGNASKDLVGERHLACVAELQEIGLPLLLGLIGNVHGVDLAVYNPHATHRKKPGTKNFVGTFVGIQKKWKFIFLKYQ